MRCGRREHGAGELGLIACLVLCQCRDPAAGAKHAPDPAPNDVQRAFHAQPGFEPLPAPKPGDWLDRFPEPGQSVAEFERADRVVPTAERRTVFIVPIGTFQPALGPPMSVLSDYVQRFAGLPVQVLPALDEGAIRPVHRRLRGDVVQLLTADLLAVLQARLPASAFGMLGVTTSDLFPAPGWNYVFGEARLTERVGVYSFARYDPRFHGEALGPDADGLVLRRSLKVMTHELGHMFGLPHCIAYRCLMNGSNSLKEIDGAPMHLCPFCLRKLHSSVGFSPAARYAALETFYRTHGLLMEAEQVHEHARYLRPELGAGPQ
jgi:archaemetzincin